jgi:hypothetical protein
VEQAREHGMESASNRAFDLLRSHLDSQSSGELIVVATNFELHLYLRAGRIAWASDSNRSTGFIHALEEVADIDPTAMNAVVEECRREGKQIFDTLVEWGLVSWPTIRDALQSHLRQSLALVTSAHDAQVLFLNRRFEAYNENVTFSLEELHPMRRSSLSLLPCPLNPDHEKEKNMALDTALTKAQQTIPECVAAGYVDMTTGMLLGVKTIDSHPQEVLDLVAAATADLFQGQNVTSIERLFRKARGQSESGDHYFREIIVFSENLLHVFMRAKREPNQAVVIVCRVSANIGMVLTKSRSFLGEIEAAL